MKYLKTKYNEYNRSIGNYIFSFNILPISCLFLLMLSCGQNPKKASASIISEQSNEITTNKSNDNCLENYYGKPEELLTKELVGNYVDFEGAEVTMKDLKDIIKDEKMAQVNCQWKIERKRRIIRLSKIFKIKLYESKTPVDRFYSKYHTLSEEEQVALKKQYDSLVLNSDEVKQKTDISTAKTLSESIGFNFEYLPIDGIGDAAVWEHKVNDLIVLVGEYQFTVNVDLEKGNTYDLEKAKLIAKAVIDKACNQWTCNNKVDSELSKLKGIKSPFLKFGTASF